MLGKVHLSFLMNHLREVPSYHNKIPCPGGGGGGVCAELFELLSAGAISTGAPPKQNLILE